MASPLLITLRETLEISLILGLALSHPELRERSKALIAGAAAALAMGLPMSYLPLSAGAAHDDSLWAMLRHSFEAALFLSPLAVIHMKKKPGADLLTAGAFISTVLPLVVFFSLQRFFVRGIQAGSVKG